MNRKSISFLLSILLMAAVGLITPCIGEAAMWIGLEGGANFVASGDVKGGIDSDVYRLKGVKSDPAFLGGITIGYDFAKEGFLGYDWPNWLKYFSLAIDVTYNNFSQGAQNVRINAPMGQGVIRPFSLPNTESPIRISHADGYIVTLSLLFIAKYGFFPSPEFPFGRLIPYAGAGPGGFFSVVKTPIYFFNYPSSDSYEVGIVTEGGIRYMLLRNVSLDAAFRYRYVLPSYDRAYGSNLGTFYVIGRMVTQQFSAIFRVNYHF